MHFPHRFSYFHFISESRFICTLNNHHSFVQEQALYEKEGLNVKKIHYVDNQDCIGKTRLIAHANYDI